MKPFDRLAWLCIWVAPVSWAATVAAILVDASTSGRAQPPHSFQTALPAIALAFGSLGLVGSALLGYHVVKSRLFSAAERRSLMRDLWFGMGYARWRRVMRGHDCAAGRSEQAVS